MNKPNKLKEALGKLEKETLVNLLFRLSMRKKENAVWLEMRIFGATEKSVEYYKNVILSGFYNKKNGPRLRLSICRNAIYDFSKACEDKKALIDLMIFFVETGVEFAAKYGDIHEQFYAHMEFMYSSAIRLLNKNGHDFAKIFKPRLKLLVKKSNGIGWGFHDNLEWMFEELTR